MWYDIDKKYVLRNIYLIFYYFKFGVDNSYFLGFEIFCLYVNEYV